jgi:hypothetical protein
MTIQTPSRKTYKISSFYSKPLITDNIMHGVWCGLCCVLCVVCCVQVQVEVSLGG